MDARVKPAHDALRNARVNIGLNLRTRMESLPACT